MDQRGETSQLRENTLEEASRSGFNNDIDLHLSRNAFNFTHHQHNELLTPETIPAIHDYATHDYLLPSYAVRTPQEERPPFFVKGRVSQILHKVIVDTLDAIEGKRTVLPVVANGRSIVALPDSMSCANVISEQFAKAEQLLIDKRPNKRRSFVNAVGMTFQSLGEVELLLELQGQSTSPRTHAFKETFSVVKGCAAPMVLGDLFLRKHGIFTRFRHLLERAALGTRGMWRLMYMDVPRRKFVCNVDGESIPVSIDTGSEKSFFSLSYLRRRGWEMKPLRKDEGFVELADGTIVKAMGYVDRRICVANRWYRHRFYVLRGLMSDALLGDEFLDNIDFYNEIERQASSHLWIESDDVNEFHAISWLDKIEDHASEFLNDPTYQVPDRDMQEILRAVQNMPNLRTSPNTKRTKWWQSHSKRQNHVDEKYKLLQSGIWSKLERLDNAESEAQQKNSDAMKQVSGDNLRLLQDADAARRRTHKDDRARLLELRKKLRDWKASRVK